MSYFVKTLGYVEIAGCLAALGFLLARGLWKQYRAVGWFLAVRAVSDIAMAVLLRIGRSFKAAGAAHQARELYLTYYRMYWTAVVVEWLLLLFIVYGIFRLTTAPLRGLQRLGTMVAGGAAVISILPAILSTMSPTVWGSQVVSSAIWNMQQVESVLMICFVLFVFVAVRPLGLSWRSNVFGVSLGLGLLAVANLIASVGMAHSPKLNALYNVANGLSICVVLAIWAVYFAMREPERREVILPRGSAFLRMDRAAQALFE